MKKKVLILGASGNIAPYLLPGLDPYYDLCLTDIVPHPDENQLSMLISHRISRSIMLLKVWTQL